MELTTSYQLIASKFIGEVSGNKSELYLYGRMNGEPSGRSASISLKAVQHTTKGYITYSNYSGRFTGTYNDNFSVSTQTRFDIGDKTLKEITKTIEYNDEGLASFLAGFYFYNSYYGGTTIDNVEVTLPRIAAKVNIPLKLAGVWHKTKPYVKVDGIHHRVIGSWIKANGIWKKGV